MRKSPVSRIRLSDFSLWAKLGDKRIPLSFDIEVTARCNNRCRHCYINLPPGDHSAQRDELTLDEIDALADQAVSLGSLWCLLTGGEPLLRKDFFDLYPTLVKKGLLVSLFTNACLITDGHVALFQRYPPREIEITVYGVTARTYERISRIPGSYAAFCRGLSLLKAGGIKVRLKAMVMRSNLPEFREIAHFCRKWTNGGFRFDPILHLRFDGNPARNEEILAERLTAEQIVALEQTDSDRSLLLKKACGLLEPAIPVQSMDRRLFQCGAGRQGFSVSYNGTYHLCASLRHPDCLYNLRRGTLSEAWLDFTPRVLAVTTPNASFLQNCARCPLMDLCHWCPAHAHLECGRLDERCEYFCRVAKTRAGRFGLVQSGAS